MSGARKSTGENVAGTLTYSDSGAVSVVILKKKNGPLSLNELSAYAGNFSFSEDKQNVIHHLEVSSRPLRLEANLTRSIEYDGLNTITLKSEPDQTGFFEIGWIKREIKDSKQSDVVGDWSLTTLSEISKKHGNVLKQISNFKGQMIVTPGGQISQVITRDKNLKDPKDLVAYSGTSHLNKKNDVIKHHLEFSTHWGKAIHDLDYTVVLRSKNKLVLQGILFDKKWYELTWERLVPEKK